MSSTRVVKQAVVGISLRLELNSQDGLRRVVFTLSKDVLANEKVRWKIGFELYERKTKSAAFVKIIDLEVSVTTKNEKNAEAVLKRKKLTVKQSAHAIGTAADLAKAAAGDEADLDTAKQSVEETLAQ
jgi:hypothetical protein